MSELKHPGSPEHPRAVFRCMDGCPGVFALAEVIYRCPRCAGLLEVAHDLEPLARTGAENWKEILDSRLLAQVRPYGSGVWVHKEFVCPEIEDENIITAGEGGTALLEADRLGVRWGLENLRIKQCGNSHTGSFKDLGMTVLVSMVRQMRRFGRDIPAIACASTGDTSASLAAYCALAGIPAVVFLPKNRISDEQLAQPLAHGAITMALDTDFDGCMAMVRRITGEHGIYLANSMNSLRIEGQKTISFELCRQLGWEVPDLVVIPGGNLGNVTALGLGFLMMRDLGLIDRLPRILCAQAENANPLYRSYLRHFASFEPVKAGPTRASAIQIGDPVSAPKAVRILKRFDGVVEQASEQELAEASAEADRCGFYTCPQTGVALAALKKLVRRGDVPKQACVVVISTAHGLKFTAFKNLGAESPIEVRADYPAVRDNLFRALDKWKRAAE